jgi:hypothetical protein
MQTIKLTKKSRSTVAHVADAALEQLPMTFSTTDLTPGRKVFFPIPLKARPRDMWDFLYIYVESKLSRAPQNPEFGFTQDDIVEESGIYVFKKVKDRIVGVASPISDLFGEVITDLSLQNRIIYRVHEMKQMVRLDDDFLDAANLQWASSKDAEEFGIKRLN